MKKKTPRQRTADNAKDGATVSSVLAWLERKGTKSVRDGMARYAIPSDKAFGIPVGTLRKYAKSLGRDHELALALWKTDKYEARMLSCFLGEVESLTPAQMDEWCKSFDNWAICDTACFHLFDRSPQAWKKVEQWGRKDDEFVKRAAFALLASLSVHDKQSGDAPFLKALVLVERAAEDERNFVKKSVNWALRSVGKRSGRLNDAAVKLSRKLSTSENAAARWVGKDALRELTSASVTRRLATRKQKRA
jgi:3-methyladenine DNA glycosylase AlkD